jgi:phenylacetate-CoA ligase
MGPGVAMECCTAQDGLHIWEDHFLAEIIDPESKEPLPFGEEGELVLTTLSKEAQPLIRYRTRDLTRLNPVPCRCGRTHVRMDKVLGRTDDMLIIRGVNVFPSQIESILLETEGLSPHYQLILRREEAMDTLEIQVEVDENMFSDEIKHLQRIERKLLKNIKEFLGVTANVKLVEPRSISRSEGKAKRIVDYRSE